MRMYTNLNKKTLEARVDLRLVRDQIQQLILHFQALTMICQMVTQKLIGRGSFGKVFLVEKKGSKDVYAMKSLRKDVIIDYDQVESTKLEKDILMQADHPFLVGMQYVF